MNVLHLGCPYFPYSGGSSQRLRNLVTMYEQHGIYKLHLATPTPSPSGKEEDNTPFDSVLRDERINSLFFSRRLYRFIARSKPDVVILHNSRALLKWLLWYKILFPRTKVVLEVHSIRSGGALKDAANRFIYKFIDGALIIWTVAGQYYLMFVPKTCSKYANSLANNYNTLPLVKRANICKCHRRRIILLSWPR